MIFIIRCTLLFFFLSSLTFADPSFLHFESAEHLSAGDNIKLYFSNTEPGQIGRKLELPNGLSLTYGELVALGDFYGLPEKSISSGKTDSERKEIFLKWFATFSSRTETINETKEILGVIHKEYSDIEKGMQHGEKPADIYNKIMGDINRQYNCITGGGCTGSWWMKPGRYLQLASNDFDHFGANAKAAYEAGHSAALDEAKLAYQLQDPKILEIAYAMNAFANHFLTDRFAAGHIRTPRVELPASIIPSTVGSILVTYMHNEENQTGVHVHNLKGDTWVARGDRFYFDNSNTTNRAQLQKTMQASANQIFEMYQHGVNLKEDEVQNLFPEADEIGFHANQDASSLFFWEEQSHQLFRRTDTTNFFDRHWTTNWWGWSTLIKLARERGIPVESQAKLILEGYGDKAFREGLITDKDLLEYLKYKKK